MRTLLYASLLLIAAGSIGCIGEMGDGYDVERLYAGKKHKLNEVARIYSTNQVAARQIDERRFKTDHWLNPPNMIYEVEPGRHRVAVERLTFIETSNGTIWDMNGTASAEFDCTLEAGKRYSFVVTELAGPGGSVLQWDVRLIDFDSGAEVARPTRPFAPAGAGAMPR